MTATASTWKHKTYDDGHEVLLKTVRFDGLAQSYDCAYRLAEAMVDTKAEKDFSVSANPTAVFIVLHAYEKGALPASYQDIAQRLDAIIDDVPTEYAA